METTMSPSVALAKVCKAYLRATKAQTYDLRAFEFSGNGKQMTKVPNLLRAIQFVELTNEEKSAVEILQGYTALENDIDYVKELISH